MIPFRFGAPSRQLFGLYQAPAGSTDPAHAVVLCNPFGQEAIRVHRLLRVLGERLAREGCHVLRFDYYATGDSDGDDTEADLTAWTDDVLAADGEVRRRSGAAASSWFGLRLGGTLAALASGRASVRNLVLWDPVADGAAYLAELADAHVAVQQGGLVSDADGHGAPLRSATEALGFPVTAAFRAQLEALTPASFAASRAERIFVLGDVEAPAIAQLVPRIGPRRDAVATQRFATRIAWASDEAMNTAIVPAEPLQAIVSSLTGAQ